jgi:hypothetical protein
VRSSLRYAHFTALKQTTPQLWISLPEELLMAALLVLAMTQLLQRMYKSHLQQGVASNLISRLVLRRCLAPCLI